MPAFRTTLAIFQTRQGQAQGAGGTNAPQVQTPSQVLNPPPAPTGSSRTVGVAEELTAVGVALDARWAVAAVVAAGLDARWEVQEPGPIDAFPLTSGSSTANQSTAYNTDSVSPTPNRLVLLTVEIDRADSIDPGTPTVTGCGLAWEVVADILWKATGTGRSRLLVYRGMSAAPLPGSISISPQPITDVHSGCSWSVVEFSSVDTSGTSGSGAIVQTATAIAPGAVTTLSATLGAFAANAHATFGALAHDVNELHTPGTGFTELHDVGHSGPSMAIITEWRSDNDTTVDASWATASRAGAIAIELRAGPSAVAKQLDTRWGLLSTVARERDVRWALQALAAKGLDTRWAVQALVAQSRDLRWEVVNANVAVARQLDARWTVRELVPSELDARWALFSAVPRSLDTRWALQAAAVKQLDTRWALRATVLRGLDTRWALRAMAARTAELRWAVTVSAAKGLDTRWGLGALAPAPLDLRWAVQANATSELSLVWRVLTGGSASSSGLIFVRSRPAILIGGTQYIWI